MKWMIASDIHGSAWYCRKMLEAFDREGAGKLVLLGDILYHGPRNSLPRDYDPKEVIPMLNERKEYLLCVRGNCDTEVDQMVLEFPILADYAVFYHEGRLFYATHGHQYSPDSPPPLSPGDVLLNGHTHIPAWEETKDGFLYLNPGSVSLPKGESAHTYLIMEGNWVALKELDGRKVWSHSLNHTQ